MIGYPRLVDKTQKDATQRQLYYCIHFQAWEPILGTLQSSPTNGNIFGTFIQIKMYQFTKTNAQPKNVDIED